MAELGQWPKRAGFDSIPYAKASRATKLGVKPKAIVFLDAIKDYRALSEKGRLVAWSTSRSRIEFRLKQLGYEQSADESMRDVLLRRYPNIDLVCICGK